MREMSDLILQGLAPPEVLRKCEKYGRDYVAENKSQSAYGENAKNYKTQAWSKCGEAMACKFLGGDPLRDIDWIVYPRSAVWTKERYLDFRTNEKLTRVDAKSTHLNARYLLMSCEDWERLRDEDLIDILMLMLVDPLFKSELDDGDKFPEMIRCYVRTAGWVSRPKFLRRCRVAGEGHPDRLGATSRYMAKDELHGMQSFPGHETDPREHHCYCGEDGSFGYHGVFRCARHITWKTSWQTTSISY
jgi:hypothetical protein